MRACLSRQPVSEFEESLRGGRDREMVIRDRAGARDPCARHHEVRVDVQPGTPYVQQLHRHPPSETALAWSPQTRNLQGALAGGKPASQYGVLAGLRAKLRNGLGAPIRGPTSMPTPPLTLPVSCNGVFV